MHEELKKEFEKKFCTKAGIFRHNVSPIGILEFIESKLPKEVEIKLVEEQTYYRCPNCDIWLSNADGSDDEDDYTDKFCPNCGAKINWR